MAPTLDVQIQDLVAATRDLSDVTNTFVGIKSFIAGTHISWAAWPLVGLWTAHKYKQATSTAEDAAAAVGGASGSTAGSLDAVARHYADAEYSSSLEPGSPADLRPPANSGVGMTVENLSRIAATPAELYAGYLVNQLCSAREAVRVAAGPTGVLPIILVIDALTIEPNIRGSGPFREAGDTWRAIAENNIKPLRDELERHVPIQSWDGDAATGFNTHMRDRFLPALDELASLAGSMGDLCDQIATGMDKINSAWLSMLILSAVQLSILALVPLPARMAASYVVIAMFSADAATVQARVANWFFGKTEAVAQMERQARALAEKCFDDSQALEAKRNLLNPRFTMVSENWSSDDWTQNWHYKAAP